MCDVMDFLDNHEGIAAWVQAVGAIIALIIAIGLAMWQAHANKKLLRDSKKQKISEYFAAFEAITKFIGDELENFQDILNDNDFLDYLPGKEPNVALKGALETLDAFPVHEFPTHAAVRAALEVRAYARQCQEQMELIVDEFNSIAGNPAWPKRVTFYKELVPLYVHAAERFGDEIDQYENA